MSFRFVSAEEDKTKTNKDIFPVMCSSKNAYIYVKHN